jgi:hypothetical protein
MAKVQPRKRASKPIPELPEYAKLWREVLERRDALVKQIRTWERSDHPLAVELAKVVKLYGGHGLTDRALAEREQNAAANAEQFRMKLRKLDAALARGGRNGGDERALSVKQLRALIDADRSERAPEAVKAVAAWLRTPDDPVLKRRALWLLQAVAPASGDTDPERLAQEERSNRAGRSGDLDRLAKRIVARAMGQRMSHLGP